MRSPSIRHVVHLRLSLIDASPEIHREIIVDRDLPLAELRPILQTLFDRSECRHYLFTDSLKGSGWSRDRRRWGDRWTMIDFRDPTVVDDSTARIGSVLHGQTSLFFAHTCDANWVVEIEPGPDDVVPATDPPVRIVSGARRSPLACARNSFEHEVLAGVLDDADHPDHQALSRRIAATIGPWATFAPETFDVAAAQRALDTRHAGRRARSWHHEPLESLRRRLPEPARAGLDAHFAQAGLGLPVVVTSDEAAHLTRAFARLISRTGAAGIPLVAGAIDPAVVRADAAALEWSDEQVRLLYATARELHLVYSRKGRLIAKKNVIAAAQSSTELWSTLAAAVSSSLPRSAAPAARDLLLLSIADGSLADPRVGIDRAARAFAIADGGRRQFQSHSWMDEYHQLAESSTECGQRCDCPSVNGATWHDIVSKAIRDAAASAASDGAVTLATQGDHRDALDAAFAREWIDDAWSHGAAYGGPYGGSPGTLPGDSSDDSDDPAIEFLRAVASVIDLLSLFGLAQADDGTWIVPPTLREFARAAVGGSGRHRDADTASETF